MRDFQNRCPGQVRRGGVTMLAFTLMGAAMSLVGGCATSSPASSATRPAETRNFSAPPLVLASSATLEVLGQGGLTSAEMQLFNARKDFELGADLPPAVAPVNISQVYIRDQQWILNGRPWENYMQTTRSLQMRSR